MPANPHGHQLDVPTASGRTLNIAKPRAENIDINDIATHLAKQCRHNGACRNFYSAAQHSLVVCDIVQSGTRDFEMALRALLHDAHDAYLGHIPRGTQFQIEAAGGSPSILDIQADIANTINAWFGFRPITLTQVRTIEMADLTALATEYRDLLPNGTRMPEHLPPAHKKPITPWPWQKAEEKFLEKFSDLESMVESEVAA